MFEDMKNKILYENFDSRETFIEVFQNKLEKFEEKKTEFGNVNYEDDELSNCMLEKNISEEFEEYEKLLEDTIEFIGKEMVGIR